MNEEEVVVEVPKQTLASFIRARHEEFLKAVMKDKVVKEVEIIQIKTESVAHRIQKEFQEHSKKINDRPAKIKEEVKEEVKPSIAEKINRERLEN